MKKNVLVFGLISGLLLSILIVLSTIFCYSGNDYEGSMVVGYAGMLLAFSLIFVAIKNYRDKYNGGFISFGKAFRIGLLITLIASSVYVPVWMIDYHFFVPDYLDKYIAHSLTKLKASGATEMQLAKETAEMEKLKDMYKNPLFRVLMTYVEVLPIGLLVSLIAALLLKRKQKVQG